jgi:putative two-component system response regulator
MTGGRSTVLIVDDAPANIQVLAGILATEYRTKAAINGKAALKIARKEPHPELILLDVVMPGMTGFDVCSALKADPATAGIPVIFVTGTADAADVAKGLSLGAAGFLTKPLDPRAVLDAVDRAIQSTRTSIG